MKYIKAYENTGDPLPNLKDYIIWGGSDSDTCEVYKNNNVVAWSGNGLDKWRILSVEHLYNFNFIKNKLININSKTKLKNGLTSGLIYDGIEENMKKFLIYQSDNLQDCLDKLEYLSMTRKLNI